MKMLPLLVILLSQLFVHEAAILYCDFESNCNDFIFDSDWAYTDGAHSPTIKRDHTLNTSAGHYRYYNPSSSERFPLTEIKTKNWLLPSTNHTLCFRMWYWTLRVVMPFNIQIVQGYDEQLADVLLSIPGKDPSTNDWALINVTLPNEKMKIFIRVNVSSKPLAFDDFSVDYCDGPTPPAPKTLYACDFESSCTDDFVSLPAYPYQWSILNASEAVKIANGAPSVDCTFGNQSGHYALLPIRTPTQQGYVGYLHLQKEIRITAEESYCLNFQYYGFGSLYGLNHLEIYSWTLDEFETVQTLWPLRGSSQYP